MCVQLCLYRCVCNAAIAYSSRQKRLRNEPERRPHLGCLPCYLLPRKQVHCDPKLFRLTGCPTCNCEVHRPHPAGQKHLFCLACACTRARKYLQVWVCVCQTEQMPEKMNVRVHKREGQGQKEQSEDRDGGEGRMEKKEVTDQQWENFAQIAFVYLHASWSQRCCVSSSFMRKFTHAILTQISTHFTSGSIDDILIISWMIVVAKCSQEPLKLHTRDSHLDLKLFHSWNQ